MALSDSELSSATKIDSDFEELNFYNILQNSISTKRKTFEDITTESQTSNTDSSNTDSSTYNSDPWTLQKTKKRRRTSQGKSPEAKRKAKNDPNSWLLDLYDIPSKYFKSEKLITDEIKRCKDLSSNFKLLLNQEKNKITIKFSNHRDFTRSNKPWPFDAFEGKLTLLDPKKEKKKLSKNKLCINKIDLETNLESVEKILKDKGIHYKNISRHKNNRGFDTTLITFDSETILLKDISFTINNIKHSIRPFTKNKVTIHRCTTCQKLGHSQNNCKNEKRCVRCNGNCENECKARDNPLCANCGGNHSSAYKGCPIYKKMLQQKEQSEKIKKVNQKITSYADAVNKSNKDIKVIQENLKEKNNTYKKSLYEYKVIINNLSEIILNLKEELKTTTERLEDYEDKLNNQLNLNNILTKKYENSIKPENLLAIIIDSIVKNKNSSSPDDILSATLQIFNRRSGINKISNEQIRNVLINKNQP